DQREEARLDGVDRAARLLARTLQLAKQTLQVLVALTGDPNDGSRAVAHALERLDEAGRTFGGKARDAEGEPPVFGAARVEATMRVARRDEQHVTLAELPLTALLHARPTARVERERRVAV